MLLRATPPVFVFAGHVESPHCQEKHYYTTECDIEVGNLREQRPRTSRSFQIDVKIKETKEQNFRNFE